MGQAFSNAKGPADERSTIFANPKTIAARCLATLLPCLLLTVLTPSLAAQSGGTPSGIAWQVKGTWQVDGRGKPLATGDSIGQGWLLQPGEHPANNSIIVLLPDGQSHLYECFTFEDCARGFRVPALQQAPTRPTEAVLARIRAMLLRGNPGLSEAANVNLPVGSPRDEIVAALSPDNRVQVEGLAARLPNGHYYCDVQPLNPAHPAQLHMAVEKSGPGMALPLSHLGLYVITVNDDTAAPRIHLFLAVVSPANEAAMKQSLNDAKTLLKQWNDDFYGWPVHNLQWAYLESLVLKVTSGVSLRTDAKANSLVAPAVSSTIAAEPVFSPPAGALGGASEIMMQSGTPGATIHYTVDSSQPGSASPIYTAPIVIQGSGLTIKAFAADPGKKDSAIVTAVFRIRKTVPTEHSQAN